MKVALVLLALVATVALAQQEGDERLVEHVRFVI